MKSRRLFRGPILYLAVILGALWVFVGLSNQGPQPTELTFTELEQLAAENVKRVVRNGDGQSPWHAAAYLELKTVWHPIGV